MSHHDQNSQGPGRTNLVSHQWAHPNLFYNYQKLDRSSSFRLLCIESSHNTVNARYSYSVIQTTFNQAPPYEALSYVWGTTDRSETVTLQDGKILRVTKVLKEALNFIEFQCATGYLWVDQISIDQDDRNERAEQVKIMGQIYSSSRRVLVWLGHMTRLDMDASLQNCLNKSPSTKDVSIHKTSTRRLLLQRLRKATRSTESPRSLLEEILKVPWFRRAWVFQEIVLPPSALFIMATVSISPHQALTMSFSELYTMISNNPLDSHADNAIVDTIRFMYRRYEEWHRDHSHVQSPIEQTLSLLAPRAQTSEDLDRLYAFFGLNFDPSINLKPSYDHSLETAMIDIATTIIEGTCSLDIFEVIPRAVETTKKTGIPTWTPDFREDHLVIPFERSKVDFRQLAKSNPKLAPVFISTQYTYYRGTIYCAGEEKRTIQAPGFVLDQVETEIGTLSSGANLEQQLDTMLKRCIKARTKIRLGLDYKNSSPSRRDYIYTPKAAWTIDLDFAPEPTKATLWQSLNAENHCTISNGSSQPYLSDSPEDLAIQVQRMLQVMHGRSLWITQSGRLSLGSHLRSGDHVCLLYGCSNPVALRCKHEMEKVLGTCFLQGWMDPWGSGKVEKLGKTGHTIFHIV